MAKDVIEVRTCRVCMSHGKHEVALTNGKFANLCGGCNKKLLQSMISNMKKENNKTK